MSHGTTEHTGDCTCCVCRPDILDRAAANFYGLTPEEREINNPAEDFTPPDSYAEGLGAITACEAITKRRTLEQVFADRYQQGRMRELAAEHAAFDADIEAHPPALRHLTAEEEAEMEPPPAYDAAIAALRAKR